MNNATCSFPLILFADFPKIVHSITALKINLLFTYCYLMVCGPLMVHNNFYYFLFLFIYVHTCCLMLLLIITDEVWIVWTGRRIIIIKNKIKEDNNK